MNRFYWILLVLSILMTACGGLLLKMGAIEMDYNRSVSNIIFQLLKSWKIVLGILFYFIPALIYVYMLKQVELSFLQPLSSLIYVVTPLLAIFFLRETVSYTRWMGVAIIIFGVFVFTWGENISLVIEKSWRMKKAKGIENTQNEVL